MAKLTAGIDIGSMATKAVIFDGEVRGEAVVPTGWEPREAGLRALKEALGYAGLPEGQVERVVGTGYGRVSLPIFDRKVTEITCHARGAYHLNAGTRTVIDIGGQDSKVIALNCDGSVSDFIMNDKCAAGTGKFLEVVARALEVSINDLSLKTLAGDYACPINSTCAIFAESEVISLLASGEKEENVAKGLHYAVAKRVSSLFSRIGSNGGDKVFTGGVAKNAGLRSALEEVLGTTLLVSPVDPQLNGAVGAAILARTNKLDELEYANA